MKTETAAMILHELGHVTRLQIFKCLVKAGHEGLPVGEIGRRLSVPGSTLSHHLQGLMSSGLVRQKREGRLLYCRPQFDRLDALIDFLKEECCRDEG